MKRQSTPILLLTHCSYLAAAGSLSPTDILPAAGRPYATFFIGFNLWHLIHVYADRVRCYWGVLDTPSPLLVSLS